jgi:hypothetical protein
MTATVISLISLFVAVGTFVLYFLTYRRDARIENENHLFKEKLTVYREIIEKMCPLIDYAAEFKLDLEDGGLADLSFRATRSEFLDNMQQAEEDAVDYITKHAIVVPENIVQALREFLFYDLQGFIFSTDSKIIEKHLDEYFSKADKVHDLMQEDLSVKGLNKSLALRIGARTYSIKKRIDSN